MGVLRNNTRYDRCLKRHPAVLERFSGGITTSMICRFMRKKGYGYDWSTADRLRKAGIHTTSKAIEISEIIFEETGVFIPYMELIGYTDSATELLDEV